MELVEFSDRSLDVGGRVVGNLAPAVIHTHMYIYKTGTGRNREVNG